ncbi:MAG: LacI family DNA-binding transcriptional regulator [Capsulimonadaceae bacterium]|nr:LacI family DNA-binding transcriptional regulator [Capsulimonadaceae bacterium]
MPTIHEVAKEAGVSPTTVSRSFSEEDLINPETRKRVLEAAKRLNYRPPRVRARAAKALQAREVKSQRVLGFQFFAPSEAASIHTDAFYAPLLAGSQAESDVQGVQLMLSSTTRHALAYGLPRMVRESMVDGMLLVGTADQPVLTEFLARVPVIVMVDNRDSAKRYDCIVSNGIQGASEGVEYLSKLGHRRIAFVMSEAQTSTFQDRLTGYMVALTKSGRGIDQSLIVSAVSRDDFTAKVQALLTLPSDRRPTALMAANDPHAYTVFQICHAMGLRIPEDISVLGFDDDRYSTMSCPPLTTLRVDSEYMGRLAVRRLQARLDEASRLKADGSPNRPEPPVEIDVPVSLIERDSCRAVAG